MEGVALREMTALRQLRVTMSRFAYVSSNT